MALVATAASGGKKTFKPADFNPFDAGARPRVIDGNEAARILGG